MKFEPKTHLNEYGRPVSRTANLGKAWHQIAPALICAAI